MEQFFQYKKPKLQSETGEEFYLNPKDMINNDKIYESTNQLDVMYYLPLNELFIVLFEENIAIVDIKRTISKNFTIIKMININELYQRHFKFIPEEKKGTKNVTKTEFNAFCYKFKENDLNKIKNFCFIENKNNLNKIYLIIEFLNLDFVIISYDNINNQNEYNLVYSHSKSIFLKMEKKLKLNYESSLIFNYVTNIKTISEKNKVETFYVLHQCENFIFIFQFDNMNYNFITKIEFGFDVKNFICDYYSNNINSISLIIYTVSTMNTVQKNIFDMNTKKMSEVAVLNKENKGNITLINFFFMQKVIQKIVLYAQMNTVYIYSIKNNTLLKSITFSLFEDWIISYCFIQTDDILYIFNSNGEYAYNELDLSNNEEELMLTNSSCQSLKLSKQIYSIKPFETKIGFFILSTQTPIKLLNSNITYFIPELISKRTSLDSLIDDNFYNKTSFYTFSLCEFLIFELRFGDYDLILKDKAEHVNLKKEDIIYERIKYYMKRVLTPQKKNENNVNIQYPNEILKHYKVINGLKDDNYINFLNHSSFKCDFCNEVYVKFNIASKTYSCVSNHETFSCSVTQAPFQETFLHCDTCNLFYSNNFKICLICQQMLNCAI